MIAITVSILSTFALSPGAAENCDWAAAMAASPVAAHSPLVQRLIKAMAVPRATPGSPKEICVTAAITASSKAAGVTTDIIAYDPSEEDISPVLQEMWKRRDAEVRVCRDLIARGEFATAKRRLESDLESEPEEVFALPLLDLELMHGDFMDAYKIVSAFVRAGKASGSILMRGSFASASMGQVFPGQREFCVKQLVGIHNDQGIAACLPKGGTAKDIACLSSLKLGLSVNPGSERLREEIFFWETALQLDPGNVFASVYLADAYGDDGYQYSKAVRLLERSLVHAPVCYIRDIAASELRQYRIDFAKVGDGKPAYPQYLRRKQPANSGPVP